MRAGDDPLSEIPDLEIRGACIACGGTLSVRLRPILSRCVCRHCGCWEWAQVQYEPEGVQLQHRTACDA
jgi:hypothetical protein